jgi:hypothetical protein
MPTTTNRRPRQMLTIPKELMRLVREYQARECITTLSGAVLSLVREGLKREGLLGGKQ